MRECISHHLACDCREALLAELKAEADQLRARVAQLEGRDELAFARDVLNGDMLAAQHELDLLGDDRE